MGTKLLNYFAYGSNLHPKRLQSRVGEVTSFVVLKLKSYKLNFNKLSLDGSSKCNITKSTPDEYVYGVAYKLTLAQKRILDQFESGYSSFSINIDEFGECFTYIANPPFDDSALPYDWYKILVILGASYHNFPGSYLNMLGCFSSFEDENKKRNEDNLSIFY